MEEQLRLDLRALSVTRRILKFKPVRKLLPLLDAAAEARPVKDQVDAAGAYAAALLPYGLDPGSAILFFLETDRNPYVDARLNGTDDPLAAEMLAQELHILGRAAAIGPDYVAASLPAYHGYLPAWRTSETDIPASYLAYLDAAPREGFGLYRNHSVFTLKHQSVVPVEHPDPVSLRDLHGYEWQRGILMRNTELLLGGGTASNALLYGDSGTGKSTTIKALANDLAPRGLRLIEVKKSQIQQIPSLTDRLAAEPLKFILFIDDLSFTEEDDGFSSLKAILEGSVQSRSANVVMYATSNRRRLIKETFSDRDGDDIHANETVQQKTALSDRFGITLPYMNPKKDVYLQIVRKLAGALPIPEEDLLAGAERYALEKGGRSGRVARQYVDQLALAR